VRTSCSGDQTFARLRRHLLGSLIQFGRHTITGTITASGALQQDWSADYRLYSQERVDPEALFGSVRASLLETLPAGAPLDVAMDDTILRKSGRLIPGTRWQRDPLSPAFRVNFIWGQRALQLSAAWPARDTTQAGAARLVPIDFVQAPLPAKPSAKADAQARADYEEALPLANLNRVALRRVENLRAQLPAERALRLLVDGRFTNKTFLRGLEPQIALIGRIRKDTKVFYEPVLPPADKRGPKRFYGEAAPSPEALRCDESCPWEEVQIFAGGELRTFRVKRLLRVRTKLCGQRSVQILVIAPTSYRLRKGGKLLYRKPAYLLCTDLELSAAELLQRYVWRWDIEVNFRDEKTLLGVGQAQVRHPRSVELAPQTQVAAYALLLTAALLADSGSGPASDLPTPKWREHCPPARPTTGSLINQLRYELWREAVSREQLTHFCRSQPTDQNPSNFSFPLAQAIFSAAA
jgi:hypothetical protein